MEVPPIASSAVSFRKTENHSSTTGMHFKPHGQFLGSLRGLLSVQDSDARWIVPSTHGIWIPPNHLHAIDSFGPSQGWLVSIALSACPSLPRSPRILSASGLLRGAVSRAMTWDESLRTSSQQNVVAVILDEIATLPHENLGLAMPQTPALLWSRPEFCKISAIAEVWKPGPSVATSPCEPFLGILSPRRDSPSRNGANEQSCCEVWKCSPRACPLRRSLSSSAIGM